MPARFNPLALWQRQRPERVHQLPTGIPIIDMDRGHYKPIWERFPMPDPGAMAYVFLGVTKQPESPYGRAGVPYQSLRTMQRPMVSLGSQIPVGDRPTFGTFYSQPLYDPDQGTGQT